MKAVTLRSRPKLADVREWVTALGVLTAGQMTRAEAELKLRAYVPLLQAEFPPAAFSQDSLAAVARECQWFPSYAEVARHLSAWWRAHRPTPPALPPPAPVPNWPPPPVTDEERAQVHERVEEVLAAIRASTATVEAQSQRLDDATTFVRARHLSPGLLDQLNPLPNGRKRVQASATTPTDHRGDAASDDDQASAAG